MWSILSRAYLPSVYLLVSGVFSSQTITITWRPHPAPCLLSLLNPACLHHISIWNFKYSPRQGVTPTYITTNQSEEFLELIMPSWNRIHKTPHYPFPGQDTQSGRYKPTMAPFAWYILFYFTQCLLATLIILCWGVEARFGFNVHTQGVTQVRSFSLTVPTLSRSIGRKNAVYMP